MGNEYGWRKERLRAEVHRRFWRTSIFITCSTCGSKCGVKSGRTAMLSSCDSLTISWLDSRAKRMPNSSGRNSRRSEERRVGKEGRSRWAGDGEKERVRRRED